MKVTVVYDNCTSKLGLKTALGFSCLIEVENEPPLLFDTGADGATLLYNMEQLNIDPEKIGKVVLSHAHGDHTGGLHSLLEKNRHAEIYIPASLMVRLPERKVVSVSQPAWITKTVFSTGELKGIEQSLAVKTARGLMALAGCSHPGVGVILDRVSQQGKLYGIIGGLHDFHNFEILRDLALICPCHCTQYKHHLKEIFPEQYVPCGVGLELKL
jgi:7,8-dihydropterin-6-yl-methyl-4-(beta-D-ribofuranosyl)aminobenzene 5'-phosphate synthase